MDRSAPHLPTSTPSRPVLILTPAYRIPVACDVHRERPVGERLGRHPRVVRHVRVLELVPAQPQHVKLLLARVRREQLRVVLAPPARRGRLVQVERADVKRLVARVVPPDAVEELVVGGGEGRAGHLADGEDGRHAVTVPGLVAELVRDGVRLGDGGRDVRVDDCGPERSVTLRPRFYFQTLRAFRGKNAGGK